MFAAYMWNLHCSKSVRLFCSRGRAFFMKAFFAGHQKFLNLKSDTAEQVVHLNIFEAERSHER